MLDISLTPRTCSCPNAKYTCEVYDATEIKWRTNTTRTSNKDIFLYTATSDTSHREYGGFQVSFTFEQRGDLVSNFRSTLEVTDLDQNETDLTCEGSRGQTMTVNTTTEICIIGT